jgi:transposase
VDGFRPSIYFASLKNRVGNIEGSLSVIHGTEATATMQSEQLFEAALGVSSPWYVRETRFGAAARTPAIGVDFRSGSCFAYPDTPGQYPEHDTQTKRHRHLNFFLRECFLEIRVPRVKLPDCSVRLIEPPWAGKLSGFTQLFEALVLRLCREMPFAAMARGGRELAPGGSDL